MVWGMWQEIRGRYIGGSDPLIQGLLPCTALQAGLTHRVHITRRSLPGMWLIFYSLHFPERQMSQASREQQCEEHRTKSLQRTSHRHQRSGDLKKLDQRTKDIEQLETLRRRRHGTPPTFGRLYSAAGTLRFRGGCDCGGRGAAGISLVPSKSPSPRKFYHHLDFLYRTSGAVYSFFTS
ncbi:hypothetical protein GDO81_020365 [Engystomops pustulosus]|uniref:Uncharacterized protein n=1 Tax=Engystomops pustulosus TaxID=76066 RepID=A0AAV6ZKE9_ENGPU|nr:hypothetical protein GDO81_020365 [Engystomops pustulosus]